MSANDSKRYYWLKLNQDFFDDESMIWLEEQPNGEKYELFYLKLCLKSLNSDGLIIRKVGKMFLPYDVKGLSKLTRMEPDTVIVALELLKKIGLIEIQDSGALYLEQVLSMVGSETTGAKRKREQRTKQKALELSEKVGHCPPNVPEMSHKNSARVRDRDRERVKKQNETSLSAFETGECSKKVINHQSKLEPMPTLQEVRDYVTKHHLEKVDVLHFYQYWSAKPTGFPINWQQKAVSWNYNERYDNEFHSDIEQQVDADMRTKQDDFERQLRERIQQGKQSLL